MDKKLKAEAKRERRMARKKNQTENTVESPDAVGDDVDGTDEVAEGTGE